jgi:hypothetical protein
METVGPYRIVKELGRAAIGVVFEPEWMTITPGEIGDRLGLSRFTVSQTLNAGIIGIARPERGRP